MGIDQAVCYRQRAVDMRKLAERAQSEHLRYLNIAKDWERLAEEAAQGDAAPPPKVGQAR